MAILIMTSGMTYALFSDSEVSTDNVMTVSIDYYVPPAGLVTEPNTFLPMFKCKNGGSGGEKGVFGYNDSNYKFFYNFTGNVPYADTKNDTNKLWALIAFQEPDIYILIDKEYSDSTTPPYKHLTFEGSIDLGGNLLNATMYIIEFDRYNGTETDVTGHCIRTKGLVQYYVSYPG